MEEAGEVLAMASQKGVARQFLDAMPEQFRLGAWRSYSEWLEKQRFNSVVEGLKVKQAYMEAFVTATFMTQDANGEEPPKN